MELNSKTYAGSSRGLERGGTGQPADLAARERIALEAAHIDNAGVIKPAASDTSSASARGDLERAAAPATPAAWWPARAGSEGSQALDNQGRQPEGRPSGRRRTPGRPWRQRCSPRADCRSRRAGWTTARTAVAEPGPAVVEGRGDLDNRGGQVIGMNDLEVGAATLGNGQQGLLGSQQSTRVSAGAGQPGTAESLLYVGRVGSLDNRWRQADRRRPWWSPAVPSTTASACSPRANRLDLRARSPGQQRQAR
ncbi:hypothetical protein ACPA9J_17145 [Pseudomonas aeruginosa]